METITQGNRNMVHKISSYLDMALPIFFFLLAISFYLRTYDSAMVKITELQMFGTILIALWLCKVFESGQWPFTKNQTYLLLPIIAFFISGIISFIRSPLYWGSFDFFVRRVIYIGIAMITVTEVTSLVDFRRVTRWLIIALAVCTIYGLIQFIDTRYFPSGPPSMGIDKFVWRWAFNTRIFSTFGNPNFYSNFLVIMVPVMMAHYFRTRHFYVLPLIVLTLANIFWTGSKGPAMGLIAGLTIFAFLLIRFFVNSRKFKIFVFSIASFFVLTLGTYIYVRVFVEGGGVTSFTFRMYTWLSTWEMINAKPILGNGIGTFWVLYPAYRRPAIFHIEAKHNTETDHSENEHLEVWQDEGIVGVGIWLWMILIISIGIYRVLSVVTAQPSTGPPGEKKKIPEEAYHMLGFFSGFLGMLIHNNTDVSMRFVSSGAPFWLLAGLNTSLIMYSPIPEKQTNVMVQDKGPFNSYDGLKELFFKIFRFFVIAVILIAAVRILREFDWCQGRDGMRNPNEMPHFVISWGVFFLCWVSSVWWFIKIALNCTRLKSLGVILGSIPLLIFFWGFFVGDVNHNRAIFFSKQGMWARDSENDAKSVGFPLEYRTIYSGTGTGTIDKGSKIGKVFGFLMPDIFWRRYGVGAAIEHYDQVNRLKPDFIMAHYFRGNVYNDWGSQFAQKTYEAYQRGDIAQGEVFRKRTEELWGKAMSAYADTRRLGPNYVQMHHQVGLVQHKWGDFYNGLASLAERYGKNELAEEYRKFFKEHLLKALESFQLYYKIDPVYDQNFYRQAQVYAQLGELDKAEQVYLDHIEAKECKKSYHQIFGGFYIPKQGPPENRYDLATPQHTHDIVNVSKPEAWVILGDFYAFVKNDPSKAEKAYRRAVILRPQNIDFVKKFASFYAQHGKNEESLRYWNKAYQLNPNDPDVQRIISFQNSSKR